MKRFKNFAFIAALYGTAGSVSAEVFFEETFVKSHSLFIPICINKTETEEVNVNLMAVHRKTFNNWANSVIEVAPDQFSGLQGDGERYNFNDILTNGQLKIGAGETQACVNLNREKVIEVDTDDPVDILVYITAVNNSEYLDKSVPMAITGIKNNNLATHKITIEQNGHPTRVVNGEPGFPEVTITLDSEDIENDPLLIRWDATDNRLSPPTPSQGLSAPSSIQFSATPLNEDVYKLTVAVSEQNGNLSNFLNLVTLTEYISVKREGNQAVRDTGADTDLDGVADAIEGDFQPEILIASGQFNARTQPGLKLRLSELPLKAGTYSPELTMAEFNNHSEVKPDKDNDFFSYVSFEVEGIEVHGSRVGVVLDLDASFPFDNGAVFPFINGKVKNFDPDTSFDSRRDYVLGAKKPRNRQGEITGDCPAIDRKKYTAPEQGDECLLILVTDGGSNDADFLRNGRVTFNAFLGKSQDIFDSDDSTKSKSKMGPGSFNLSVIAALIVLLSYRAFRKK
jgi:hypothetical protein